MSYDAIVLGGGSAGIVTGAALGGLGLRVLLIEKDRMGGERLNTGCVPSKALIHSAKVATTMRRAARFGLNSADFSREDAARVMEHVRETVRAVERTDAMTALLEENGVEIRFGDARFVSPNTLELNGEILAAPHFVLCTGSRPRIPNIPGREHVVLLTNHDLFGLNDIPAMLLVMGGGPVGVEMAQAFARLGCRVTLVHNGDRILPRDDPELALELQDRLREDGVDLRLNAQVSRFEGTEAGGAVAFLTTGEGEPDSIPCRHVLAAIGRLPNVEGLNLDIAGVRCTEDGVQVDDTFHTTGPHVWACGDALGKCRFSHMAEYEAKIVAKNIFQPIRQRSRFDLVPWATFTDPELAHVGLTEQDAQERDIPYIACRQPFSQNDRALVEGEGRGQVKILVEPGPRGRILGAQILGPRAGELIQEFILAMEQGMSVRALADSVHVYPTLSMACQHAAQRWYQCRADEPTVKRTLGAYRAARPLLPVFAKGLLAGGGAGLLFWLSKQIKGDKKDTEDAEAG